MKRFKNPKIIFTVLLIGIIAWSVGLRAVEVINKNYLFGFDIGRDFDMARRIIEDKKFTLIGAELGSGSAGINGIFQGPGYYYLLAVAYMVGGSDPYAALLTMFVFGLATLAGTYLILLRIFDKWTAVTGLFLVGTSPLIISQSRFMWAPHPVSIIVVLLFYVLFIMHTRPRLWAPVAMFLTGMTYHFELAMTVPMIIALYISFPFIYRIKDFRTYVYSILATGISIIPAIIFEIRHGWMAFSSILAYSSPESVVGRDVWLLRIQDHMGPYIANAANSFMVEKGILPYYLFNYLCVFLFVVICYLAIKTKNKPHRLFFQFFLLLLVVSYIVLLFLNNIIWDYYLIHAHFIYIFVFAYVYIKSIHQFKKSIPAKIITVIFSLFIISIMISSAWRMKINYTYDLYDLGGVEKIKGKKAAIDYVYNDAKGKEFSAFTFMAPIYTYPYDFLFKTYAKKKYGYMPGDQKKGLVYLIIEPDMSKPWTYKGWLETVIVGGNILKTETLYTGHIIQVRQFP